MVDQSNNDLRQRLLSDLPAFLNRLLFDLHHELNDYVNLEKDRKKLLKAIAVTVHYVARYTLMVDEILFDDRTEPVEPLALHSERYQSKMFWYALRALSAWPYPEHFEGYSADDMLFVLRRSLRVPCTRGGAVRLEWTRDKKLTFLYEYDAAYREVKAAVERVRDRDPLLVRIAALTAANREQQHAALPRDIIEKIAARPDQKATAEAPTLQELALEVAARRLNTQTNSYLAKVLTKARKLKAKTAKA
jgi:hypothetical protein